jgi:hypothetical protein
MGKKIKFTNIQIASIKKGNLIRFLKSKIADAIIVIIAVREFKKIKSIRQQIKIVEEIIFLSHIDKPLPE